MRNDDGLDEDQGGGFGGIPPKGERSKWALYVAAAFVVIIAVTLLFR